MQTVWKFPLQLTDRQIIMVPRGGIGLTAALQRGTLCIWYHCDPGEPLEPRSIWIVGTGQRAPDQFTAGYWGTVFMADGDLVWHIFEVMEKDQKPVGLHLVP